MFEYTLSASPEGKRVLSIDLSTLHAAVHQAHTLANDENAPLAELRQAASELQKQIQSYQAAFKEFDFHLLKENILGQLHVPPESLAHTQLMDAIDELAKNSIDALTSQVLENPETVSTLSLSFSAEINESTVTVHIDDNAGGYSEAALASLEAKRNKPQAIIDSYNQSDAKEKIKIVRPVAGAKDAAAADSPVKLEYYLGGNNIGLASLIAEVDHLCHFKTPDETLGSASQRILEPAYKPPRVGRCQTSSMNLHSADGQVTGARFSVSTPVTAPQPIGSPKPLPRAGAMEKSSSFGAGLKERRRKAQEKREATQREMKRAKQDGGSLDPAPIPDGSKTGEMETKSSSLNIR